MKKPFVALLFVAALSVATGAAVWLWQTRLPRRASQDVGAWLRQLDSDEYQARARATAEVAALGPRAVPYLVAALQTRDSALELLLLAWLRELTPLDLRLASPALVRQRAATLLGKIGPGARGAVPALVRALNDKQETVRAEAAQA